jgi:hypothetical protein
MLGMWSFLGPSKGRLRLAWLGGAMAVVLISATLVFVYWLYSSGFRPDREVDTGGGHWGKGGVSINNPFSEGGSLSINKPFSKDGSLSVDKPLGRSNSQIKNAIRALGVIVSALPKGEVVLDAPTNMKVGDKRQVNANVGINVPIEVLQKKSQAANQQITGTYLQK